MVEALPGREGQNQGMEYPWFAKLEDALTKRPRFEPSLTIPHQRCCVKSASGPSGARQAGHQNRGGKWPVGKEVEGKDGNSVLELVVPNVSRIDLLAEAHDQSHRSIDYTFSTLKDAGYWWPNMRTDIREYCQKCIICRAATAGKTGKGLLVGWGIEPRRFEVIHIDFAGPLTKSAKGNSYVLSLVDRATGWVEMVPTPDRTTASAVKALLSVWVPRYGVQKAVVSNNGIPPNLRRPAPNTRYA